MWYDYVLGTLFFGLIVVIVVGMIIWALRCSHVWEEVLRNPNTVIYRCKKCGKERRYEL